MHHPLMVADGTIVVTDEGIWFDRITLMDPKNSERL